MPQLVLNLGIVFLLVLGTTSTSADLTNYVAPDYVNHGINHLDENFITNHLFGSLQACKVLTLSLNANSMSVTCVCGIRTKAVGTLQVEDNNAKKCIAECMRRTDQCQLSEVDGPFWNKEHLPSCCEECGLHYYTLHHLEGCFIQMPSPTSSPTPTPSPSVVCRPKPNVCSPDTGDVSFLCDCDGTAPVAGYLNVIGQVSRSCLFNCLSTTIVCGSHLRERILGINPILFGHSRQEIDSSVCCSSCGGIFSVVDSDQVCSGPLPTPSTSPSSTSTLTPTPTQTPTATSTPSPVCDPITVGDDSNGGSVALTCPCSAYAQSRGFLAITGTVTGSCLETCLANKHGVCSGVSIGEPLSECCEECGGSASDDGNGKISCADTWSPSAPGYKPIEDCDMYQPQPFWPTATNQIECKCGNRRQIGNFFTRGEVSARCLYDCMYDPEGCSNSGTPLKWIQKVMPDCCTKCGGYLYGNRKDMCYDRKACGMIFGPVNGGAVYSYLKVTCRCPIMDTLQVRFPVKSGVTRDCVHKCMATTPQECQPGTRMGKLMEGVIDRCCSTCGGEMRKLSISYFWCSDPK